MWRQYFLFLYPLLFSLLPLIVRAEVDENLDTPQELDLGSGNDQKVQAYLERLIVMLIKRQADMEKKFSDKFGQLQENLESKMDKIISVIETQQRNLTNSKGCPDDSDKSLDEKLTKILSSVANITERFGGIGVTTAPPITSTAQSVSPTARPKSCSQNGTLVWKIDEFAATLIESKDNSDACLFSCPFYTSSHGYKLRGAMYINGFDTAENSHLSIFLQILPGEYDVNLDWPFSRRVSFTLIDQDLISGRSMAKFYNPEQGSKSFERPSNTTNPPWGYLQFISHELLKTRNYVKNDTIIFQITVEPGKSVTV